jgi:hypothetical protein
MGEAQSHRCCLVVGIDSSGGNKSRVYRVVLCIIYLYTARNVTVQPPLILDIHLAVTGDNDALNMIGVIASLKPLFTTCFSEALILTSITRSLILQIHGSPRLCRGG